MSDKYHSFDIGGCARNLVYFLRVVLAVIQRELDNKRITAFYKVYYIILFLAIPRNNVYFCVKSMIYWTYGTWRCDKKS